MKPTKGSEPVPPLVRISRPRWAHLIRELRRRGGGSREAGAFLLADRGDHGRRVSHIVYFDDLDPRALRVGGIQLKGPAFSALWDICDERGLVVIADAHTHPGSWVEQSAIDAADPMVAVVGHVALIVPNLALRRVRKTQVGVHLYLGNEGWKTWTGTDASERLSVRGWR